MTMADHALRDSGIEAIGRVPWGTHFCQFYSTKEDLVEILVPYFKAGLANNEFCLWVTADPLTVEDARRAMSRAVPDFDAHVERGHFEILPYTEWHLKGGSFDIQRVLSGWMEKLDLAREQGRDGIRLGGNNARIEEDQWTGFTDYEAAINRTDAHNIIAVCAYRLEELGAQEVMDVVRYHEFALLKRGATWEMVENSASARTKAALEERERKYHALFDAMCEGFALCEVILDETGKPRDFRFLETNAAFYKATNLKPNVKGKTVKDVLPEVEPFWIDICGQVALTGEPASFEHYTASFGRWHEVRAYSPRRMQFVMLIIDVTDRKQGEEVLRESEEQLSTILASVPLLLLVVNAERCVIRANQAAARFVDRYPQEMVGLRGGEALTCLHSLDDPAGCGFGPHCQACQIRLTVVDTLETGTNHYQVEWRLPFARGEKQEELTCLLSTIRLPTPDRQVLLCIEDISERKKAEEKITLLHESLNAYVSQVEATNKELESFAYSVSHDLRAPLRSMVGFSDALLEDYSDKLDETGRDFLRRINDAGRLMNRLIDDMLKLSRTTRSEINPEEVDLGSVAASILNELCCAEPERKVEFTVSPEMTAYGDARLLRVVLENLIQNAWKFTRRTPCPRIEIGITERDGGKACFVRDNGAGFDMAYAGKLFAPFQRLHRAEEFPGTGIGLATVQRIIHRHGGKVWAEGEVGKGATFFFTLPNLSN